MSESTGYDLAPQDPSGGGNGSNYKPPAARSGGTDGSGSHPGAAAGSPTGRRPAVDPSLINATPGDDGHAHRSSGSSSGSHRSSSGSHGSSRSHRSSKDRDARDKTEIRRKIQDLLREEDARSFTGSLGTFLSGLGTCLVGGFVFATVMWLATGFFTAEDAAPLVGWRSWFGVYLVAVAVIIFLRERRSHGKQTVESFSQSDHDADADVSTSTTPVPVQAVASAWGTLMKWGPQSVLEGFAGLRGKWTARQQAMFKRAAQVLVTLVKYDGAVGFKYVVRPPEDMRVFFDAIGWMEKNMWVGRSSDGERIYISSPGKQKLAARDLIPKSQVKVVREG